MRACVAAGRAEAIVARNRVDPLGTAGVRLGTGGPYSDQIHCPARAEALLIPRVAGAFTVRVDAWQNIEVSDHPARGPSAGCLWIGIDEFAPHRCICRIEPRRGVWTYNPVSIALVRAVATDIDALKRAKGCIGMGTKQSIYNEIVPPFGNE